MPGKQGVQSLAELRTGTGKALVQLEEQAVALILLILHVQRQRQAILEFGTKVLQITVIHACEPVPEVVGKGLRLLVRRFQSLEQEGEPPPQQIAGFAHALQGDIQPGGKFRLGPAQGKDKLVVAHAVGGRPARMLRRGGGLRAGRRGVGSPEYLSDGGKKAHVSLLRTKRNVPCS